MKWEVELDTIFPGSNGLHNGYRVIKQYEHYFDTKTQAQAFADQLNTKCLSTDPAWAAKAEERMAERQDANKPWDVV